MKTTNGIRQEWARIRVDVVTHDNCETWTATTPAFPELCGTGTHPDIAAANLLRAVAEHAINDGSDPRAEAKRALRRKRTA